MLSALPQTTNSADFVQSSLSFNLRYFIMPTVRTIAFWDLQLPAPGAPN
jgi:hypothetical protein